MTTTNTHAFNLDLNLLVEEAFERCGAELRTGYDLRTATRSLNLLTIEWANRGINLWTVEQGQIPLVAPTATYDLPATTIDLMSQVIRTGSGTTQSDIAISRVSNPTYASIPSKNDTGRPIQVYIDRQAEIPKITLWPIPNDTSYTFVYWMLKRIDDAGTGVNTQHIPFRFLPCMVAGLAYYLSLKIPEAGDRVQFLKSEYEEQWLLASTEDREKATLTIAPRTSYVQEIKMKEVPANKKKSLGKLPTPVRNKMGYMEEGGSVPKIKKGSPEDKVKKKFLDTNPLFKLEKKVKKHLKDKLDKKKKARRRPEFSPGLVQPPRRRKGKPSDPAAKFKRKPNDDRGNERSIDALKRRREERERRGLTFAGGGIVDRNYLKGR